VIATRNKITINKYLTTSFLDTLLLDFPFPIIMFSNFRLVCKIHSHCRWCANMFAQEPGFISVGRICCVVDTNYLLIVYKFFVSVSRKIFLLSSYQQQFAINNIVIRKLLYLKNENTIFLSSLTDVR
jgi:hypothetical protein